MQPIADQIAGLFASLNKEELQAIHKLPQSGSDREYYRITTTGNTYIVTRNQHVKENNTFIAFSRHFKEKGCHVPEIYAVDEAGTMYIQEDVGSNSLLEKLEAEGHTDAVYELYEKSL